MYGRTYLKIPCQEEDESTYTNVGWQGYIANRNRTLEHLYDNEIVNNVFIAGDSHQNWVSGQSRPSKLFQPPSKFS